MRNENQKYFNILNNLANSSVTVRYSVKFANATNFLFVLFFLIKNVVRILLLSEFSFHPIYILYLHAADIDIVRRTKAHNQM